MTKGDLEQIKSWAFDRQARTLVEISRLREKIFSLSNEISKEKKTKRKKVLKDILNTLLANESLFLEKLAFYKTIAKRAKDYLDSIYPEFPTLG